MQDDALDSQISFLVEADKLKSVLRRNYTIHADRKENSAEHSWHAALFAMVLAELSNEPVDIARVVKMLVVHDIVEVDAGDTFIYDHIGIETQFAREAEAAERIFGLLPSDQETAFRNLWKEFESAVSPEAKFAKAIDRFTGFIHNYETGGRGWTENGILPGRVLEVNEYVKIGSVALWEKIRSLVELAVAKGFFTNETM
jgi:putative hydrolase of HD superfamily